MITRKVDIIVKSKLKFDSGSEWHSNPFKVEEKSILRVEIHSNQRIYMGFFKEDTYQIMKSKNQGSFPFSFGEDTFVFNEAYAINSTSKYRVVLRLSVFNKEADVDLLIERNGPPEGV